MDSPEPSPSSAAAASLPPSPPASSLTIALVRDLLFASKISATAAAVPAAVKIIRDPAKLATESATHLIVDLNLPGAIEAAAEFKGRTGARVTGFVSHSDAATIAKAKQANLEVIPRSRFVEGLEEMLKLGK